MKEWGNGAKVVACRLGPNGDLGSKSFPFRLPVVNSGWYGELVLHNCIVDKIRPRPARVALPLPTAVTVELQLTNQFDKPLALNDGVLTDMVRLKI